VIEAEQRRLRVSGSIAVTSAIQLVMLLQRRASRVLVRSLWVESTRVRQPTPVMMIVGFGLPAQLVLALLGSSQSLLIDAKIPGSTAE
jgi:hypothetical protein